MQFHYKNDLSGQIFEKFRSFSGNFTKKFDFSRQVSEDFRFFRQFHKNLDFLENV